jgi:hypothetical protein
MHPQVITAPKDRPATIGGKGFRGPARIDVFKRGYLVAAQVAVLTFPGCLELKFGAVFRLLELDAVKGQVIRVEGLARCLAERIRQTGMVEDRGAGSLVRVHQDEFFAGLDAAYVPEVLAGRAISPGNPGGMDVLPVHVTVCVPG